MVKEIPLCISEGYFFRLVAGAISFPHEITQTTNIAYQQNSNDNVLCNFSDNIPVHDDSFSLLVSLYL
jgi:hypothetical protein